MLALVLVMFVLCVALWLFAVGFMSCSFSYCCDLWILSGTVLIVLGKREPVALLFFSSAACVLSVIGCLLFLLILLAGYDL